METGVTPVSPAMRQLLAFITVPLRGSDCLFGGTIPRVSPGAHINRPSATKNEPRGCVTGYTEVTPGCLVRAVKV